MRKLFLLMAILMAGLLTAAQNPRTVFTIPNKKITLPCGTHCTPITVEVPHIKQTNDYVVTNPGYLPFAYTTPTGTELTAVYVDDIWGAPIALPFAFNFCFFGTNYNSLLIGSNSVISFDQTLSGDFNQWSITGPLPNIDLEANAIFGPLHDIDPKPASNPDPTQRKIEWRVEGNAPYRRFIASYNDVAYYEENSIKATHQMVLYENTGIIEVYIKDKPVYTGWNDGLAIMGLQNATRTRVVTAAGKNGTIWGKTGMDSCFRFIPSSGVSMFRRAELIVNNTVIATNTTDTATASPGSLRINFPNVCPTTDSVAYAIKVYYGSCSNPALQVSFIDTVYVKSSTLAASNVKTDATCINNGTITVTATGGTAPYQYSIDGGNSFQSSNVFASVTPGSYNVVTKDGGSCPISQQVNIGLIGAISVNAGNDTTICRGASFMRTATSAGATSYSWTPVTDVVSSTSINPMFAPQNTTTYVVTARQNNCVAQDAFVVNVVPGASINAGTDAIVIANRPYQMQASGSTGNYLWTPSSGLSASNILNPIATPAQTTTYTLKVTTLDQCTATDNVTITVVPYCVKPMEAFSPNGDGINEYWLITNGNCLKTAKAQVFNRYGAKVFESNDYRNDWNGTYSGKPLPDGTYYFIITYTLLNDQIVYLRGNVTILR